MSTLNVLLLGLALAGFIAVSPPAHAAGKAKASIDANGDGKISLQEFLARRGRIFERIDADHDGQLTKDEVAAFQTRMDNAAAGAMIRHGKARGEGGGRELQRLEELTAAGPVTRAQWDALMTKRFQKLDTAGAGFITLDQMRPKRAAVTTPAADPMAATAPKL